MKKFFVPALAVLAMASCSKSELVMRPTDGQVEIKAASQALSIETRTPYEGQIGEGNTLQASVLMSKTTADYTTLYGTAGTMTFADTTTPVGFDVTAQYYPADGSTVYFCALYPSTGWGAQTTTSAFTFNGSQDVMAAKEVSSNKTTANPGPNFEFNHLLTKLTVNVVAEDAAAVTAWGNITGLTLDKANGQDPNKAVTVNLAGGSAATTTDFSGADGNDMPFYTITGGTTYTDNAVDASENTIAITESETPSAYALVAPIDAKAQATHFNLSVTTTTSGTAIDVPVNLEATEGGAFSGDTQGQAFEITITFKATAITATATVTDWKDAGSSDVEIQ